MSQSSKNTRINSNNGRTLKRPLFPLNVECKVRGFRDDPYTEYKGYFRKIINDSNCLFEYEKGFRIADRDYYSGGLEVCISGTNEIWDFYNQ